MKTFKIIIEDKITLLLKNLKKLQISKYYKILL